eukprot:gene24640-26502_t
MTGIGTPISHKIQPLPIYSSSDFKSRRCAKRDGMNKPVRLAVESVPETLFTAREYLRMHDAGAFNDMNVELVRGELRKMMSGGLSHGEMNGKLIAKLITAYSATDRRLAVHLMIGVGPLTIRGADIAVVHADAPSSGPVPPDRVVLIVEIAVTTLGTDLGEKQTEYADAGVPDYWVADVAARVMHVMRSPEGDRYAERSVVPFGQPLALQPAPDLDQGLGQIAHHRFVMRRTRREAQSLGATRNGRIIDRLDVDAIFGEQHVADLLGLVRL